jgi:hypothetical protein
MSKPDSKGKYVFSWFLAPNGAYPDAVGLSAATFTNVEAGYEWRELCAEGLTRESEAEFFNQAVYQKHQLDNRMKRWHAWVRKRDDKKFNPFRACFVTISKDNALLYTCFIFTDEIPEKANQLPTFAGRCAEILRDPYAYHLPEWGRPDQDVFSTHPEGMLEEIPWDISETRSSKLACGLSDSIRAGLKQEFGSTYDDAQKIAVTVAVRAIGRAQHVPDAMSDLADKAHEAKMTLMEAITGIGQGLEGLKPMRKEMVEEIRGMRESVTAEVASTLKPLEDIRRFFLGPEHDKEIARLREFVELCERLKKLKDEGFLDSVADTLLKLS